MEIDDWGVDIAYSGTQKCLGVPPGLSPLTMSDRARDRFVERSQSWYLDLRMIAQYVATGGGPHVPPHRADLDDLRVARRSRCGARRRARGGAGAPRRVRRAAAGRAREARLPAVRRRGPPPARAHDRVGPRRRRRGRGAPPPARALRHRDRRRARRVRRQGLAHRLHGPHRPGAQRDVAARRARRLLCRDDSPVRPARDAAPAGR